MGNLTEKLMEELNCETVFTIPVFGGIGVAESVVVTWIIMAVMVIAAIILTRNLRVDHISRRQAVAETIVTKLNGMVESMIGPEGKRYVPYLATVLVYIGIANIIGLFGFKSPTKDLNVTAALAIMSIVLVEGAGIYQHGVKNGFTNSRSLLQLLHQSTSLRSLQDRCRCVCDFSVMYLALM